MNLGMLIRAIPATFWGIVVGSLFTVVGVVITNAANTRRLRLQHEHEWRLESKERDLNLRRDTYLAAMEAIATAVAAVGRFGNLTVSSDELELLLTRKSPAFGKVSIVGKEETIQAVARFSRELTGVFLRLSSKREKLNWLMQRSATIEEKIAQMVREQGQVQAELDDIRLAEPRDADVERTLQKRLEFHQQRLETLRGEEMELMGQIFPAQMDLVRDSMTEVATLERLLVPLIDLIRAELELSFDADFYAQIVEEGHRQQLDYLEAYIQELAPDFAAGTAGLTVMPEPTVPDDVSEEY